MRINVIECIAGTTVRTTWVSSGVVVGTISSALLSGSETVVNSTTAVDSGNGHFFALHDIPSSGGWFINQWVASVDSRDYRSRQLVKSARLEVD